MNGLGPLVDRLVATISPDGLVIGSARPPGPAGLAHTTLAEGALELEVDVAEPDNLVGLRFAVDRASLVGGPLGWALRAILGQRGLDQLLPLVNRDLADIGPNDEVTIWQGNPVPVRLGARALAARAEHVGGLEQLGRLALRTAELTRTERSALGTAIGLFDLAENARTVSKQFQPMPRSDQLTDAAYGHLRRWAGDPADDWWVEDVSMQHRDQLTELVERMARHIRLSDPPLAQQLHHLIDTIREMDHDSTSWGAAAHPSRGQGPHDALGSLFDAAQRMPASAAFGPPTEHLAAFSAAPAWTGDEEDDETGGRRPIEVVIDPALVDVDQATGVVSDGHVHVEGNGTFDDKVWVRVFRFDPEPVMIAMAPVHALRIGAWSARALLPADAPREQLRADITATPSDPWRSAIIRDALGAVDLGAQAARATRRGDANAAQRWSYTAAAWADIGDTDRAHAAERLAETADDQTRTRPRTRRTPGPRNSRGFADAGPLAIDLVE